MTTASEIDSKASAGPDEMPSVPGRCSPRRELSRVNPCESGQAMVEFVLVLPLVLLILFGIAQFALALNSANDETHVANLVARYAAVDENPATGVTLQAWGKKQLDQSALKGSAKVCISFPSGKAEIGQPLKVVVTSTVSWLPILKLKHVTTTEVVGTAYMRLEAPPTAAVYKEGCE